MKKKKAVKITKTSRGKKNGEKTGWGINEKRGNWSELTKVFHIAVHKTTQS